MTEARLRLVPFAAESHGNELSRKLRELGYTVEILSDNDWLAGHTDKTVDLTILLFARRDLPCNDIIRVLKNGSGAPSLAVVHYRESRSVSDILDCCDEFSWWPCHDQEFALRLNRLLPESAMELDIDAAKIAEEFVGLDMVGQSPRFLEVLASIKQIARCDAPVLIQGVTGTGKEMAARAIHYLEVRRDFPFAPINCGAIPENLLVNELFGHERGAYTDAREAHRGLVAQAEGGSLFLDEIDTLSPGAQVTLLRFLQDYEYKPLGDKHAHKANVRIMAASNVGLLELVNRGEFRQDLWFRLNVLSLTLPPLTERPGDISLLAEHFLQQYSRQYGRSAQRFSPLALAWMNSYDWPGNVRELENVVQRAVLMSDGPVTNISHLLQGPIPENSRPSVPPAGRTDTPFNEAKSQVITDFEKQYLGQLMNEAHGNVTLAAKRAGKERRALGKLLKKHGIARYS